MKKNKRKHPGAVALGRIGGAKKSQAKTQACRENGKLGGPVVRADDLQKTYEEMKAKGVEFLSPPTDQPYGKEAIFKDNGGYVFSLQQER